MRGAGNRYKSRPVGKSPKASSKTVTRVMKSNKSSGTGPEIILSEVLRKRLLRSTLPGTPDFVYKSAKLAVFVHGCWWHGCPEHYRAPKTHAAFWRRKLERNRERDRLNKSRLESMGWRVLEVWEHEVNKDPKGVVNKIRVLAKPETSRVEH